MKKGCLFSILSVLALGLWSTPPDPIKFFNTATQKTIVGEVTAIIQEETEAQHPFVVITLKEKKSALTYRVEVAPQWFFEMDLMAGSLVEINGSVVSTDDTPTLLASAITFQGERFVFRDPNGFPLWRGRGSDRANPSGKGNRRRRGKG